jgi:UDP-glucose 4-epimerase
LPHLQGLAGLPALRARHGPDLPLLERVSLARRVGGPRHRPTIEWTERIARQADQAKQAYVSRFATHGTAKTLVTGATGFIGKHLLKRLLTQRDRVRILVRHDPGGDLLHDGRVEVFLGDLGNAEDVKLIYMSSLSVIHAAAARNGRPIAEDWPLEPHPESRGLYSQTKLAAERLVTDAVRERKLRAVILRPGEGAGLGPAGGSARGTQTHGQRLTLESPISARRHCGRRIAVPADLG